MIVENRRDKRTTEKNTHETNGRIPEEEEN